MKILIIASYAPSLVNFRKELLKAFKKEGHEVSICAPEIAKSVTDTLSELNLDIHQVPLSRTGMNPVKDILYCLRIISLLRKTKPDIILTYTVKPNIWGGVASRFSRAKSYAMVTGLGYAFTRQRSETLRQRALKFIQTKLYRFATSSNTKVIFQNTDDQDEFIKSGCLADPRKAYQVNGSGVNLEYFTPAMIPSTAHFLMISRLLKSKGVTEYAQASVTLKEKYPNVRFSLVGYFDEGPDGIDRADLTRWEAQGLEYVGPMSDVRPALAACSVYVLPSYREGTPRSVLEAMATGRAVLTSDAPGCRDTVKDGQTGYLVPVRNVEALVQRMEQMIASPDQRISMGQAGLVYVRNKYDVHKVNHTMLDHMELLP